MRSTAIDQNTEENQPPQKQYSSFIAEQAYTPEDRDKSRYGACGNSKDFASILKSAAHLFGAPGDLALPYSPTLGTIMKCTHLPPAVRYMR